MTGTVYLVGAGPGDFRLVTHGAIECMKEADVVVYDRLADERILNLAKDGAELIYVGKASANHTMKQEDINQLLANKALEGKCVVRLKGGDPFVFGRGGEEALLLEEKGVPFEIVPGVTSAIAAAAYAGIPVTHRAVATSFAVVTGHEDPTKGGSNMRWKELATATDTIVFLMGVANLPAITRKLIENGRDAATPAAVVRWGTRPEQRVLVTTVGEAAADVEKNGIKPPAVFIVGEVVTLREKLAWFDDVKRRPLFGKTVLVTRARTQASVLVDKLARLGANVIELPAIRMREPVDGYAAIDDAIGRISSYDWIIFTSVNGVSRFFERLAAAKRDSRSLALARVAAIGGATAEKLRSHGIIADLVPSEYKAEGIIAAIKDSITSSTRVLMPRAAEAREVLPDTLRELGAAVDVAPVYETVVSDENAARVRRLLDEGKIDCATFASSSTVKNLVKLLGDTSPLKKTKLAAIGPVTAETCETLGVPASVVASEYTIDGLVAAVVKLFKEEKNS